MVRKPLKYLERLFSTYSRCSGSVSLCALKVGHFACSRWSLSVGLCTLSSTRQLTSRPLIPPTSSPLHLHLSVLCISLSLYNLSYPTDLTQNATLLAEKIHGTTPPLTNGLPAPAQSPPSLEAPERCLHCCARDRSTLHTAVSRDHNTSLLKNSQIFC